jgi:integrase
LTVTLSPTASPAWAPTPQPRAAAKLRPIPLKNLRHTHASLLQKAGANPKMVSERLGHHSVAFTLDTYAHVLPGIQAAAAEELADLVFGEEDDDEGAGSADAS